MNETIKTLVFVILASTFVAMAVFLGRSEKQAYNVESIVGEDLFPNLTDALKVHSLQIIRFDPGQGNIVPFEVRQADHRWVLPSHNHYPADAKDQVVNAATSLIGLRVISVVSEDAETHAEFGVVAPDMEAMRGGTSGVGKRVVMKDEKGNILLDMIVGREVGATTEGDDNAMPSRVMPSAGGTKKHYVRRAGQTPVYTVELDASQLSTDFSDWIEKDLMKIQPWDIAELNLLDYTLTEDVQSTWNGLVKLQYNDMQEPAWKLLNNLILLGNGGMRDRGMPPGKTLNEEKLDACRNALAEMRIADVARKPEGLSEKLKATDDYNFDEESRRSLAEKGFYLLQMPGPDGGTQMVLLSTEGEISVTTKMGLRYTLRFGNVAGAGTEEREADAAVSLNRYLFIMAELDEASIPQPKTVPVPEIPDGISEAEKAQLESEREEITATNRENLAAYEEELEAAGKRANMLNERFAQWYYVIPESVYQKIRLTQDIIFIDESAVKKHDHTDGHVCDENCDHGHDHSPAPAEEHPAVVTPVEESPADGSSATEPPSENEVEEPWPVFEPDAGLPEAAPGIIPEEASPEGREEPVTEEPAAETPPAENAPVETTPAEQETGAVEE